MYNLLRYFGTGLRQTPVELDFRPKYIWQGKKKLNESFCIWVALVYFAWRIHIFSMSKFSGYSDFSTCGKEKNVVSFCIWITFGSFCMTHTHISIFCNIRVLLIPFKCYYRDVNSEICLFQLNISEHNLRFSTVIFCYILYLYLFIPGTGYPLKLRFQIPCVLPVFSLSNHTFSLCQFT